MLELEYFTILKKGEACKASPFFQYIRKFNFNYFIFLGENTSTNGASFLMNDLGIEQHTQVALEDYLVEIFLEDGDLYSFDNPDRKLLHFVVFP